MFLLVERGELLPIGRVANDDDRLVGALFFREQMIVKRMQRLAGLKHDVVGHVDDIVDATDANHLECVAQPVRTGANLHAAYDAGVVARAMLGVVEPDIHQRRSLHVIGRQLRHFRHDK